MPLIMEQTNQAPDAYAAAAAYAADAAWRTARRQAFKWQAGKLIELLAAAPVAMATQS